MPRRKNPRLMPVSEDDVNALTHKAIQLAKSGLESKVRQFQRATFTSGEHDENEVYREYKAKRYPNKEDILDMPVQLLPSASYGRIPKSRSSSGKSIRQIVKGDGKNDDFVLSSAGFTYTDVRGKSIDGLLSITIDDRRSQIPTNTSEINWQRLNDKTPNENHDIYAYWISTLFRSASATQRSRLKDSKQKQVFIKIRMSREFSFRDTIKLLDIKKGSLAYDILFNHLKEIVMHEFIHAMESMPQEWEPSAFESLEDILAQDVSLDWHKLDSLTKRRRKQLISKWKKNFPNRDIDPYGIYINEPKERRAYLSQVLNEIVDYYQKKDGGMEQAFFTARPEMLAEKSSWLVENVEYFYPETESYFLSAIYQFQQEFENYNLPKYQHFDKKTGYQILEHRRIKARTDIRNKEIKEAMEQYGVETIEDLLPKLSLWEKMYLDLL